MKTKSINDLVRIDVLEEEVEYYKTLIRPTDTGHVHTAINFIQDRIRILKGRKKEWLLILQVTQHLQKNLRMKV